MNDRQSRFLDISKENHGRWCSIARSYAASEADDLLQEIQLQVWKSLENFREEASVNTWTYRIALNTAMNWNRSERNRNKYLPTEGLLGCEVAPISDDLSESSRLIQRVMAGLPPEDRAILLLSLDDITYEQMSEIVGVKAGALRVRVHRIKQKLKKMFSGDDHGL